MPRRLYKRRRELISAKTLEEMRESIRQGFPWIHEPAGAKVTGLLDLHALVKGPHFAVLCDFWTDPEERTRLNFYGSTWGTR